MKSSVHNETLPAPRNDDNHETEGAGLPMPSPTAQRDVRVTETPQTGSSVFSGSMVGLLINHLSAGRLLTFPDQQAVFDAVNLEQKSSQDPSAAVGSPQGYQLDHIVVVSEPLVAASTATGASNQGLSTAHHRRSQSLSALAVKNTDNPPASSTPSAGMKAQPLPEGLEADDKPQRSAKSSRDPHIDSVHTGTDSGGGKHHVTTMTASSDHDHVIVDWYGPEDLENPQNWPYAKKIKFTGALMLLTFTVYLSSSIYAAAGPGLAKAFNLDTIHVQLGISTFILGYAAGPLLICPLADFPFIGKTGVYIPSTFLFTAFSALAAEAPNYTALIMGRFWSGFFGSPALSLAAASLSDVWNPSQLPYAMALWSVGAVGGPTLAPLLGGFVAMKGGWHWPLLMVTIAGGVCTLTLPFVLPESSAQTILYRRAKRLREAKGEARLRAQSEIDASKIQPGALIVAILTRPFVLCVDPAALYCHVLLGIAYGCFWLDFESFPMVFQDMYDFNLGELGLPFIGLLVALAVALVGYTWYLKRIAEPRFIRTGKISPEERLEIALVSTFLIPISLFIYGWTARPNLSYWGPIIGASLVLPGVFLLYQSIFVYLPLSYAASGDAPSIMASNTFFRSIIAAAFPLFGRDYYEKLGLGVGSTVLACVYLALIPFLFVLWKWGDKVRAASRYASKD